MLILALLVGLVIGGASLAHAQGPGIFVAGSTGRPTCASITNPIAGLTWCLDGTNHALKVYNGVDYAGPILFQGIIVANAANTHRVTIVGTTLSETYTLALPATVSGSGNGDCLVRGTVTGGIIPTQFVPCGGGGGGNISSIGGQAGPVISAGVNDTNIHLTWAANTVTPSWAGALATARGGLGGNFGASTGLLSVSAGTVTATLTPSVTSLTASTAVNVTAGTAQVLAALAVPANAWVQTVDPRPATFQVFAGSLLNPTSTPADGARHPVILGGLVTAGEKNGFGIAAIHGETLHVMSLTGNCRAASGDFCVSDAVFGRVVTVATTSTNFQASGGSFHAIATGNNVGGGQLFGLLADCNDGGLAVFCRGGTFEINTFTRNRVAGTITGLLIGNNPFCNTTVTGVCVGGGVPADYTYAGDVGLALSAWGAGIQFLDTPDCTAGTQGTTGNCRTYIGIDASIATFRTGWLKLPAPVSKQALCVPTTGIVYTGNDCPDNLSIVSLTTSGSVTANASATVVGTLRTRRAGGNVGGTFVIGNGTFAWQLIGNQVAGGDLMFMDPSGAVSLYFTETTRRVGIDTTVPAAGLDVRNDVILSTNAAVLPTSVGVVQIAAPNTSAAFYSADGFAAQGGFVCRRANGTPTARTTLVVDNIICGISGRGAYDATNYSSDQASVSFYAAGTWSGSSRPTYTTFGVTPIGSTTLTEALRIAGITGGAGYRISLSPSLPAPSFDNSRPLSILATTTGVRVSSGGGFVTSNSISGLYVENNDASTSASIQLGDRTSVTAMIRTIENAAFTGTAYGTAMVLEANAAAAERGPMVTVTFVGAGASGNFYSTNGFLGVDAAAASLATSVTALFELNCRHTDCALNGFGVVAQNLKSVSGTPITAAAAFAALATTEGGGATEGWTDFLRLTTSGDYGTAGARFRVRNNASIATNMPVGTTDAAINLALNSGTLFAVNANGDVFMAVTNTTSGTPQTLCIDPATSRVFRKAGAC